jgi:hypothetical protein
MSDQGSLIGRAKKECTSLRWKPLIKKLANKPFLIDALAIGRVKIYRYH